MPRTYRSKSVATGNFKVARSSTPAGKVSYGKKDLAAAEDPTQYLNFGFQDLGRPPLSGGMFNGSTKRKRKSAI